MDITIIHNNTMTGHTLNDFYKIISTRRTASIILYPESLVEKATPFECYLLGCETAQPCTISILKHIIFKIATLNAIQPSTKDNTDNNINAAILTFLFISEKFLSDFSIYIFLPHELYHLFYDFSSYYDDSICIHNDSDYTYTLTISDRFYTQKKVYTSPHSEIYKYFINGQYYAIKLMTNTLSEGNLYFLNRDLHSQNIIRNTFFALNLSCHNYKSLVCSEYVEGTIIHGLLSSSQAKNMLHSILLASDTMSSIDYQDSQYLTIQQKIESCTNSSETKQAINIGLALQDYCNWGIPEKSYTQLCLYDLHRDNLIINNGNWHIIDTDSVILGTDSFMFSCTLAASFLLEEYSPLFVSETVINSFGDNYERVYFEIAVRLYIGISFFSCKTESDILYSKYINSLYQFVLYLESENHFFSKLFSKLLSQLKTECSMTH